MNRIRIRIRRLAGCVTGLAAALTAVVMGAPAAFAEQWPHPLPGLIVPQAPAGFTRQWRDLYPPSSQNFARLEGVTHHVNGVTGGMTGWQIALIAVGAAIVGALLALLVERARATRSHRPATAH
jgi:hypothetical protein